MPSLPARPSLEHLKKQAKRLLKAAQTKNTAALAQVGPYFGDPAQISLQQAQLVIARDYGFSSWLTLKRHVEAARFGEETLEQRANRFLDLACLHYGPDTTRGPKEFEQAAELLLQYPDIARQSLHAAAAAGDADAVAELFARDPGTLDEKSGPFHWTPLMYAAYARVPGRSSFAAAQLLVQAGADPNAHYLWDGIYRFAVLTGVFGDGEGGKNRLPEHPDMVPFARALLEAGATPNECQGAYNRCFTEDDTHLHLMLDYGLKDSDLSDWWRDDGGSHRTMHFQLIIALRWGFAARARLMIEHGVDLNQPDIYYDSYTKGFTPYQVALLRGMPETAELIKSHGGDAMPLPTEDAYYAACMCGDLDHARALQPKARNREKESELICEAAGNGQLEAVETMIALGFELNPHGRQTPLHRAAWRGCTEVIPILLRAGADPKLRDADHFSPPLGHAFYAQNHAVIDLLLEAEMDIFLAAATGTLAEVEARLDEDASWINARFARVCPPSENACACSWAPPLWFAATHGQVEMVKTLLARGAVPKISDPKGRSIAEHARDAGHAEIAQLLS